MLPNFGGIFESLINGLFIGIIIAAVFVPLLIIVWLTSFKHHVTVRHLTGGKIVVVKDRGKIIKDRKGVEKLKLMKTPKLFKSDNIAVPPDDVIETTKKGQYYIDVYRTTSGQYFWVKDNGIKKGVKLPDGAIIENFEAMNTMDRDFYANEWELAEKYKKKNISELIAIAAPWIVVFLMFTMLIVNWDTIAAPALESQKESLNMQKQNTVLVKEIQKTAAIMQGVQIPEDEEIKKNDELQK